MARASLIQRSMFALTVALFAASLSDPLVETISNTGVFGRPFADDNHQSVVPVVLAGFVAVIAFLAVRIVSVVCRRRAVRSTSLGEIAVACADRIDARSVATMFGAQLVIVFAMEACEAAFGSGGPIAGLSWLGAPIAFALGLHLAACIAIACAVKAIVRLFFVRVVAVISFVLDRLLAERARVEERGLAHRCATCVPSRFELPYVRRLRGRAPPILAATV